MKEGLPREEAIRAMTIRAAQIAGIEERVGSLLPGKDADFVVFADDPLLVASSPSLVAINGQAVYRANS